MSGSDDEEAASLQMGEVGDVVFSIGAGTGLDVLESRAEQSGVVDRPASGHDIAGGIEESPAVAGELDGFRARGSGREELVKLDEIVEVGFGTEGIDEHLHASAADESVVPAVVVVELEREDFGGALVDQLQGAASDFCFDASAAESADLGAVGEDEHAGAGFLRSRATGFHKQCVGDVGSSTNGLNQLLVEICEQGLRPQSFWKLPSWTVGLLLPRESDGR